MPLCRRWLSRSWITTEAFGDATRRRVVHLSLPIWESFILWSWRITPCCWSATASRKSPARNTGSWRTVGEKDGAKTDTFVFVGEPTNAPSKAQRSRLSRFCNFEISFYVNAFLMPRCSTIFWASISCPSTPAFKYTQAPRPGAYPFASLVGDFCFLPKFQCPLQIAHFKLLLASICDLSRISFLWR